MSSMRSDSLEKYFFEANIPGSASFVKQAIKIKEHLYSGSSEFQTIDFYATPAFGTILALDGIVQTTEGDGFVYNEMIVHLPMFYHQNPKDVLIIGGGDGGALKEALKHKLPLVTQVEIDGKVMNLCKKFMPSLSEGALDDARSNVITGDGKAYIESKENVFDVIVLDLSDPEGPAKELSSVEFYKNVKRALKPNGIISVQGGSFGSQTQLTKHIRDNLAAVFKNVKSHKITTPTYIYGDFHLAIASEYDFTQRTLEELQERSNKLKLDTKYYSPEMHLASGVLPPFIVSFLQEGR
jgi:spermidine synthase